MVKECLAAAAVGAVDSVSPTVQAVDPAPVAKDYDAIILGAARPVWWPLSRPTTRASS